MVQLDGTVVKRDSFSELSGDAKPKVISLAAFFKLLYSSPSEVERSMLFRKKARKKHKKKLASERDFVLGSPASPTAEIFVAGGRNQFRSWAAKISGWSEGRAGAVELVRLENVYLAPPVSRLQPV